MSTRANVPSIHAHVHVDRESLADVEKQPRTVASWVKLALAALGAGALAKLLDWFANHAAK